VGVGVAALLQSGTETLPGWWALVLYLIPAGLALGIVIAVLVRRRRRRRRQEQEDDARS
jgi:NhaP-type Na+/H+ or K+/H+ antiporter